MRTTRLAPSPTGALHLGNARTFLLNWLLARQDGWRVVLRIDDLDGPRTKPGADAQAIEDLAWLGLDWDEGPSYQSQRRQRHDEAIRQLLAAGAAYPCTCTRREIELAASAPHAEDGAAVYPGTCRGRYASIADAASAAGRPPALRFAVPAGELRWRDELLGEQAVDVNARLGDFVVAKNDGTPGYQLAVVVDDADSHVSDVVRGDDLHDSAPRQILLYRALGLGQHIPRYIHLPLVVGPDGRRLAKRHGDTRLSAYRERGVPAARVLRVLADLSGIDPPRGLHSARDLLGRFDLSRLPRRRVVVDAQSHPLLRVESARRA